MASFTSPSPYAPLPTSATWSSSLKASIDWSANVSVYAPDVTAVQDQLSCASSWAFSSVASVSYGAAIGGNSTSLQSAQQLLDCTGGPNTCSMGWPYAALDYMVDASTSSPPTPGLRTASAYPYSGTQGACATAASTSSNVVVTGYEQVPSADWFNLLFALQSQPVIAFLFASHPSFMSYNTGGVYSDPTCGADTTVDHSLLVIGYSLSASTPYWLIRNSWGPSWGTNGNMLMAITGGMGICNIHMVPPIYPLISFPNPCTLNPCGTGTCSRILLTSAYTCSCPSGYSAVAISATQQICTPVETCASHAFLPCGLGTCSSGIGSYTCTCPTGFTSGSRADGSPICLPSLSGTSLCSVFYPLAPGDTCSAVASLFSLSVPGLISLNAGLVCSVSQLIGSVLTLVDVDLYQSGQQLCVKSGSITDLPTCTSYYVPRGTDTCSSIRIAFNLTWFDFYTLNPGLQCNHLYPSLTIDGGVPTPKIGASVCVSNINPFNIAAGGIGRLLYSAKSCKSGNYLYSVQRGDYCSRIISKYCRGSSSAFQQANNGWACTDKGLYQGQKLCVLTPP